MSQDPFKNERFLQSKLDEYHVKVPDIPLHSRKKRWERFINYLASPAKNPIDPMVSTLNGIMLVKTGPVLCGAVLSVLPVLVFV
ncbi:hypothetical protein P6709_09725 [Jeotgalibacillus sp. ET6]|uniref:hypothetical protein n=1 Tax=Jeotgalibacillus sp. ET6 TaxID=3037260 RepID=UPI00241847D6|nr:hypothetical protein [Jeotgalibacillus sp. ET6]MDG5472029.1 hypothetical protein [Jeotgalibacillus sp. ET6]